MAAFGILAALRERDRSGEGQVVDVSMADGALSWLAMVAARTSPTARPAARRRSRSPAGSVLPPLRVRRRLGHLGALEPKFWQAWCRGVGREDLIERSSRRPGATRTARSRRSSPAHARRVAGVRLRARLLPGAGARPRRGARVRARARRGMVVELDQPGAERPVRLLGVPVKLDRTPGDPTGRPARRSASTRARCWRRGLRRRPDRGAGGGRARWPARRPRAAASFLAERATACSR